MVGVFCLLSDFLVISYKFFFLTNPLVSNIFLLTLSIFFSRHDLSVLYWVFKTNLPLSMVSILVVNLLYTVVSNTIYYLTYLNQGRRSEGTVLSLSISIFSTSAFKSAKAGFAVELDISITVRPFTSAFIT